MKLKEILPQPSTFHLKLLNDDLTMNPTTLKDEIWLEKTFGFNGVEDMFQNLKFGEIARVVYRFLDNESKSKLKKQKVVFYNEEGEENEVELGGVELLNSLISGWKEKEEIIKCLLSILGLAIDDNDNIADSSDKKKVQ